MRCFLLFKVIFSVFKDSFYWFNFYTLHFKYFFPVLCILNWLFLFAFLYFSDMNCFLFVVLICLLINHTYNILNLLNIFCNILFIVIQCFFTFVRRFSQYFKFSKNSHSAFAYFLTSFLPQQICLYFYSHPLTYFGYTVHHFLT